LVLARRLVRAKIITPNDKFEAGMVNMKKLSRKMDDDDELDW